MPSATASTGAGAVTGKSGARGAAAQTSTKVRSSDLRARFFFSVASHVRNAAEPRNLVTVVFGIGSPLSFRTSALIAALLPVPRNARSVHGGSPRLFLGAPSMLGSGAL